MPIKPQLPNGRASPLRRVYLHSTAGPDADSSVRVRVMLADHVVSGGSAALHASDRFIQDRSV